MTPQRIFDGDHLRADLVRNGGDRLMVTFDHRVLGRKGFGTLPASEQFAAAGFDQVMITTRANDWFVNPDITALEDACAALRPGYGAAHAIGFSMGGYGAFRLARALRLDHVVAVSPQVSIDSRIVPFERRYTPESKLFDPTLGDMIGHVNRALRGTILVDDLNLNDLTHARMLQVVFPQVRLLRLSGGGHPCTRVLRAAQRTGTLQRLAMRPEIGPGPLLAAHRTARGDQAAYWMAIAKAAGVRHPDWAAHARQMAANLQPAVSDGVDAVRDSQ